MVRMQLSVSGAGADIAALGSTRVKDTARRINSTLNMTVHMVHLIYEVSVKGGTENPCRTVTGGSPSEVESKLNQQGLAASTL